MRTTNQAPVIVEMTERDIELAERAAKRIGYTQTAYTSSSAMRGLFCLPDRPTQRKGCFIKTEQFGLLFVQDLEDLNLHDLAAIERSKLPKDFGPMMKSGAFGMIDAFKAVQS